MIIRRIKRARLAADSNGVTAIEFALLAPVFISFLIGAMDIGQMAYATALLHGAVERAARDSSLESSNTTYADSMVKTQVGPIVPGATFTTSRKAYFDFVDIGRPEKWTDKDSDGNCNAGEPYVDENDNGRWDKDIGKDGNGGADDVIVYQVTVKYKPVFRVPFFPARWAQRSLTATAIRKNQPFATQQAYTQKAGVC